MHHDLKFYSHETFSGSLWAFHVIKNNLTAMYFKSSKYEQQRCKQTVFRIFLKRFHNVVKIFGSFSILSPKTWLIKKSFCRPTVIQVIVHLLPIILCVSCPWYHSSVYDFFGFGEMNAPQKRREKHLNLLWKVQRTALVTLVTDCRLIIKQ